MELRVLGPIELSAGDRSVPIAAHRQRELVSLLVLERRRPVTNEWLIDHLWNGAPPSKTALHSCVYRLRKSLGSFGGSIRVLSRSDAYQLDVPPGELDVDRFEWAGAEGRQAMEAGRPDEAVATFRSALRLWRGEAFTGVDLAVVRDYADQLRERWVDVTEQCLEAELAVGRHVGVAEELEELTETYPQRESLWRLRMLALARSGRRADALEAYRRLCRLLDDELGIEPSASLRELHQQILANDPQPTPARPGSDHRLDNSVGRVLVPRMLPAARSGFTGRMTSLARLDQLLAPESGAGTEAVVISAISGAAGIGKTMLALQWAHRVASRFPDGQLYVDLRGFHPSGEPMQPAEAMRLLLTALGVRPEQVPVGLDAQAGLYRSLLANRRILLVLDNARDSRHVRSLLPGTPGCLVVVTSRNQLTGLVGRENARPLLLDLLTFEEARELLADRLGADRVDAEPQAVETITAACAQLPLALAIAAARAAIHPDVPLQALADDLVAAGGGLDAFSGAGPEADTAVDIGAVFSWSYRQLSRPAARLFRLLSLHPGPDITVPAAASLAGVPAAEARKPLAELTSVHLLTQHQFGRYSLHDLLRTYSSDLVRTVDTEATRSEAIRRVLDHYLHTAFSASRHIEPSRLLIPLQPSTADWEVVADRDQALSWFAAEDQVLVASVQLAAGAGFDVHTWQLMWCLAPVHDLLARWRDLITMSQLALEAATRAGDQFGQAHGHCGLGVAHTRLGNWASALPELHQATELFRGLGNSANQAHGHYVLSAVLARLGHRERGITHAEQAVELFQRTDQPVMQARALDWLGWAHAEQGKHQDAFRLCQQALEIQEKLGDRLGAASTWDTLGHIHSMVGHFEQATACFRRALAAFRELGDPYHQADALCGLGDAHQAVGASDAAVESWQAALHLLEEIGHQRAKEVRSRLTSVAKAQ